MHFGHENIIKNDGRPFKDADEMDRGLIELWNGRVSDNDDVWILGDFCYKSDKNSEWYLKRLKGRKHLIVGNHDRHIITDEATCKHFETIEKLLLITDELNGEKVKVVLSHFPIAEWNGMHRGTYHVYGHIHKNKDDTYYFMKKRARAVNAGCMLNNYMPVSLAELIENNKFFDD